MKQDENGLVMGHGWITVQTWTTQPPPPPSTPHTLHQI